MTKRRRRDWLTTLLTVIGIVVLIAVIAFGIWAWIAGPCELYSWSKVSEIPARCVMHR